MAQWVSMREAARQLGKSQPTISRLAAQKTIKTKTDPTDRRVQLVNLEELRKLYALRSEE